MSCGGARSESSLVEVNSNDIQLNSELLNKFFERNNLDEKLEQYRNEYKTRREYLQKRQQTFHEKETKFKERILSYEMYIKVNFVFKFSYLLKHNKKELAMKQDRSVKRIEDEKVIIKNKQIEIDGLKRDIERFEKENKNLDDILLQYQPHLNFLQKLVEQTDHFHSIDEMIEKFDMLDSSYQAIITTIQNSNEQLNDLQRQLVLTNEKKNNKILLLNNRIHQLEKDLQEIQQRREKIQTEIQTYQQISIEHLTENGAINIAIESMFDLVKRYSHHSRKHILSLNNEDLLNKLQQIDIFLSDLIYYVDYGNNKEKKTVSMEQSIYLKQEDISEHILDKNDGDERWRGPCGNNEREKLIQDNQKPFCSYKIQGEDNRIYTIQMMNIEKSKLSQSRHSLSSTSSILHSQNKRNSLLLASTPKLQTSTDTQPRSSITQNRLTTFKLSNEQENNEKTPFSIS